MHRSVHPVNPNPNSTILGHGVQHFYLIDDMSTDNVKEVLDPYIEKEIVTMFPTTSPDLKFRQVNFLLPIWALLHHKTFVLFDDNFCFLIYVT